jgi:hypothetical protein
MALMLSELYEALLEAGASEAKAKKAAEAVASYDDRLGRIERRLDVLTYITGANLTLMLFAAGLLWQHLATR